MNSFILECGYSMEPEISGYWNQNAFPPNQFFLAVAAAASVVTNEKADRIEAASRQCNRKALTQQSSEMASVNVGSAHVTCHSFTRDGGSVGLSIVKRRQR